MYEGVLTTSRLALSHAPRLALFVSPLVSYELTSSCFRAVVVVPPHRQGANSVRRPLVRADLSLCSLHLQVSAVAVERSGSQGGAVVHLRLLNMRNAPSRHVLYPLSVLSFFNAGRMTYLSVITSASVMRGIPFGIDANSPRGRELFAFM
ncbi:hypothetical protein M951_chr3182 (nucleomorph) [Lotharella oceanica]|uniref:Uncharacterized protein n=1 Tax=Lotharella oceanica TaxID=641309 RepID=A0A060D710_9EUKA|nr:hypothetical protein M951_chr123 [Lotharella oceanica]AIB09687.1 hypothetical protein M951_chr1208 [Lotharella oceanica]AIB09726.1 hypothetical protein M951_chr223 [Lotharella oceanica]AIB09890.1 hypothetical protein M951_chr2198 [Lotharella oceanica]AIB09929.1 hypothetical protein M951_chr323 [Lotharella oceanica]